MRRRAGHEAGVLRTVSPVVLAFGTYDETRHPRVRVLLDGLAAHGATITTANVPLGLSTAERVAILRQAWRLPVLVRRLLGSWTGLVRASTVARRSARPDAILVGYLGHFDVVLARMLFPRTTIVLDHLIFAGDTARDRGAGGLRARLLGALDRVALACADVIVVDTDEHAAMVSAGHRSRVVVTPVGAHDAWFRAAPGTEESTASGDAALSVVFFGLMTPLQGATTVAAALADLDGLVRATVIGTGQDGAAVDRILAGTSGVDRRPWVEPDALAALVAAHDVCLGIFGVSGKATRVVPNKVYQGAAAGCAVVTSDTAPQRRALGDAAAFVPAGDPEALAAVLAGLAADRDRLAGLRAAARSRASQGFTPTAVTEALARRLGLAAS